MSTCLGGYLHYKPFQAVPSTLTVPSASIASRDAAKMDAWNTLTVPWNRVVWSPSKNARIRAMKGMIGTKTFFYYRGSFKFTVSQI